MVPVIWLGEKRGNLSDWITQLWVRTTGKHLALAESVWLDGPTGNIFKIGKEFFANYAKSENLELLDSGVRGLIPNFDSLMEGNADLTKVGTPVREFYEQTSEFDLDAWSEWHPLFKPFGRALSIVFSTRLQQLNVPLSSLDSSKGMTSNVLQMRDRETSCVSQTAWVRELRATENVLYAGSYSICKIPNHNSPCVKVVFPLPNGRAIVLMKAKAHDDGSLSVQSIGKNFGDPGFYFVVSDKDGKVWARYVRTMKEEIRVYPAESDTVRADHTLWLWGITFLRLHYRMRRKSLAEEADDIYRAQECE